MIRRSQPVVLMVTLSLSTAGWAAIPTLSVVASEASLDNYIFAQTGNAIPVADPNEMTAFGSGLLVYNALPADDGQFIEVNTGTGALTLHFEAADLIAAMDAANGGAAAPADMEIQGIAIAGDGDIIVTADGGAPETGSVFSVNPTTFAVTVLSGATATSQPSVEGLNGGVACIGNTAYMWVEADFGGTDALVSIDTDAAGPDIVASTFVTAAQIVAVTGEAAGAPSINDLMVTPSGDLLAVNSGRAVSNDDILLINVTTPPAGQITRYVAATDIEADLATTDVGFNWIERYVQGGFEVLLLGNFNGAGALDDAVIQVVNGGGGSGTASVYITEADAQAQFSATSWFIRNASTALIGNSLYLGNTNNPDTVLALDLSLTVPVELSVFSAN